MVKENLELIDEVIEIKTQDSIEMSRNLTRKHCLLVGISSGANILAAKKLERRFENILTILPDKGEGI